MEKNVYAKYSDYELIVCKEDREDCLSFDDEFSDIIEEDLALIEEQIELRQKAGIWDYSCEVEHPSIQNDIY